MGGGNGLCGGGGEHGCFVRSFRYRNVYMVAVSACWGETRRVALVGDDAMPAACPSNLNPGRDPEA